MTALITHRNRDTEGRRIQRRGQICGDAATSQGKPGSHEEWDEASKVSSKGLHKEHGPVDILVSYL